MSLVSLLLLSGCPTGVGVVGDTPDPGTADTSPSTEPLPPLALQFDGDPPTNLLMLSVDTLRRDHVGRYDDGPSLTPFLDERFTESVVLDDLTACSSWTVPTTACWLSGASNLDRAPHRGMVPILVNSVLAPIPQDGMLPVWLSDAGYRTVMVTANGYFSRNWGNAQGYETLELQAARSANGVWETAQDLIDPARGGEALVSPWLLHLHFMEPHRPYDAPAEHVVLDGLPDAPAQFDLDTVRGQEAADDAIAANPPVLSDAEIAAVQAQMRARYQGEVRWIDASLSDIWADLDARGLLDDSLVVFWTDHGEDLWEHGPPDHGWLLHAGERRAVTAFWARNLVAASHTAPVETRDVAPTILTALGLDIPAQVTGTPVGHGPDDAPRFSFLDGRAGPMSSVRRGDALLHFRWNGSALMEAGAVGYYDIAADPTELVNRYDPAAATQPVELLELWSLLVPKVREAEPYVADDPRGWQIQWPSGLPHPDEL